MKVAGLIFVLSFLAFKLILGENSCITTYQSTVYLVETNTTSTVIKTFQPSSSSSSSSSSSTTSSSDSSYSSPKITFIPWQNESETQQGVVSLFSCTTVHNYLFLLISPTIPTEKQRQSNDGEHVKSIIAFDYESHQWKTIPLYFDSLASTLITSSWNTHYIVYNTRIHTVYYFDIQFWSWYSNENQGSAQSPPPSTPITPPEMTIVNSTLYYFFNDDRNHHRNHIYTFDLVTKRWQGHFASFWSNTSLFSFSSNEIDTLYAIPKLNDDGDRWMRTIGVIAPSAVMVETPHIEQQTTDLVTGMAGDLVLYNGSRLIIYQPTTNTISAIYGQDNPSSPKSNNSTSTPSSASPSFWSTSEGERIKIALGCSLSIGVILATVIGMILLRNKRRQHHQDRDLLESPIVPMPKTNQNASSAAVGTPVTRTTKLSTSMQSLSFLNRDNAMVWSRNVHQLLALITFRRHQEEEKENEEAEENEDYPSMIKTSTTVSALAMSSMILSIISSSSYSIAAANNNNAFLTPQASSSPMNRRSLDMACPLPRNIMGQAESSSSPSPP
ncbi:hypothetical protein BCR42DRAFT_432773 [Absidia repens]|uniref:Uncharacterized protein n=1 Tax=Absidia repens TaxID=90262 RepID=A0A1X2IVQ3_9FUNG|nr:hypothetical protein BCR42DRAFT_432773 [Absidia repens]